VLTQPNSDPLTHSTGSIEGRIKIIDPLVTMGPSARVEVVNWSDSDVCVRLPRQVLVGTMVHMRTADKIFVGEVRHAHPLESGHEIK
jgi:hypothetical protein